MAQNPAYLQCPTVNYGVVGAGQENDITQWGLLQSTPTNINNTTPYTYNGIGFNGGDTNLGFAVGNCETYSTPPVWGQTSPTLDVLGKQNYILYSATVDPSYTDINDKYQQNVGGVPDQCLFINNVLGYDTCDSNTYHSLWKRNWSNVMNDPSVGGYAVCCNLNQGSVLPGFNLRSDTCSPDWSPSTYNCFNYMQNLCTYGDWNSTSNVINGVNQCDQYIANPETSTYGQQPMSIFMSALSEWNDDLQGSAPQEDDPFLPTIIKYCSANPGTCDSILRSACSTIERGDITTPNLYKAFSCFLSPSQTIMPGEVPQECDTLCTSAIANGGIPIGEYTCTPSGNGNNTCGFGPKVCQQSSCVVDDISINMINSTNSGNINFNTICGSCGSGGSAGGNGGTTCTCVFNGISINEINSKIGGSINFNQSCGLCSNGSQVVPCSTLLPNVPNAPPLINPSTSAPVNFIENILNKISTFLNKYYPWSYVASGAFILLILGIIIYLMVKRPKR